VATQAAFLFVYAVSGRRSLGAELAAAPPPGVNDQTSCFNDTATITATSPIKIRRPDVPICHIGSSDAFVRQS
jgi:hypothetical protein